MNFGERFILFIIEQEVNAICKDLCGHITIVCPQSYYGLQSSHEMPLEDSAEMISIEKQPIGWVRWTTSSGKLESIQIEFMSNIDCNYCKPCDNCYRQLTCKVMDMTDCPFEVCIGCKTIIEYDFRTRHMTKHVPRFDRP